VKLGRRLVTFSPQLPIDLIFGHQGLHADDIAAKNKMHPGKLGAVSSAPSHRSVFTFRVSGASPSTEGVGITSRLRRSQPERVREQ
jgi:hypothetical protein